MKIAVEKKFGLLGAIFVVAVDIVGAIAGWFYVQLLLNTQAKISDS